MTIYSSLKINKDTSTLKVNLMKEVRDLTLKNIKC